MGKLLLVVFVIMSFNLSAQLDWSRIIDKEEQIVQADTDKEFANISKLYYQYRDQFFEYSNTAIGLDYEAFVDQNCRVNLVRELTNSDKNAQKLWSAYHEMRSQFVAHLRRNYEEYDRMYPKLNAKKRSKGNSAPKLSKRIGG